MLRRLALVVTLAACGDNLAPAGLDDVSVLFPLPSALADPAALRLDTAGNGGVLLPAATFARIAPYATQPALAYASWRIVAARIDPCFPDLAALDDHADQCQRLLRLVAQPLVDGPDGPSASDDAIHLLYELSAPEFHDLAVAWLAVGSSRTRDPDRALGVHPEIAAEGLAGPTASALRALIVAHAGTATLLKLTFIARSDGMRAWQFGGFHADAPGLAVGPSTIPEIGTADPSHGTSQITAIDRDGIEIEPSSNASNELMSLADSAPDPVTLTAALQQTLDLDNPTRTHVDRADCSGCHVAGRLRRAALDAGAPAAGLDRFESYFNLALVLPEGVIDSPAQQRGFGYNGAAAVWSQRVVNDSAAIAEVLPAVLAD